MYYKAINAAKQLPEIGNTQSLDGYVLINTTNGKPITDIWAFRENHIELNNNGAICGPEISYSDVEWLQPLNIDIEPLQADNQICSHPYLECGLGSLVNIHGTPCIKCYTCGQENICNEELSH